MKLLLLCLVLFEAVVVAQQPTRLDIEMQYAVSNSSDITLSPGLKFMHNLQRRMFDNALQNNTIYQVGTGKTIDYGTAMALMFTVIASIGTFFCLMGCCLGCFQFGGKTCGLFEPQDREDEPLIKHFPLVVLLISAVAIGICFALVIVGSVQFDTHKREIANMYSFEVDVEALRMLRIRDILYYVNQTAYAAAQAISTIGSDTNGDGFYDANGNWENGIDDMQSQIDTSVRYVDNSNIGRKIAIGVPLLAVAVVLMLGLLGGICKVKPPPLAAGWFAFVAIFLLFVMMAVHIPLGAAASDMCNDSVNFRATFSCLADDSCLDVTATEANSGDWVFTEGAQDILSCPDEVAVRQLKAIFATINPSNDGLYIELRDELHRSFSCFWVAYAAVITQDRWCACASAVYMIWVSAAFMCLFLMVFAFASIVIWKRLRNAMQSESVVVVMNNQSQIGGGGQEIVEEVEEYEDDNAVQMGSVPLQVGTAASSDSYGGSESGGGDGDASGSGSVGSGSYS